MPPSPICSHVFQPLYVILHLSPQVILNLHGRELRGELQDRAVLKSADLGPRMDVESRHDALRHFGADAVEGFEGALAMVRRAGGSTWRRVNAPSRATARGS